MVNKGNVGMSGPLCVGCFLFWGRKVESSCGLFFRGEGSNVTVGALQLQCSELCTGYKEGRLSLTHQSDQF